MYLYLFVLLISSGTILGNVLLKKFQQEQDKSFLTFCLLNFVNAITAAVFFFVANGFTINMNVPTFMFSVANAVVVALLIVLNVCTLSKAGLVVVSILTTAGTVIGTSLFGLLVLKEDISFRIAIAITLLLISIFLPFIKEQKNNHKEYRKRVDSTAVMFSTLLFICSGLSTIINKLFVGSKTVCDSNSYFFMLNFILVISCIVLLFIYCLKTKVHFKTIYTAFTLKQYGYIATRTLASNIGAILTMLVLTKMNISLYSVLTTALTLVGSALASGYYFKEKSSIENKISVVLAILAVILAK